MCWAVNSLDFTVRDPSFNGPHITHKKKEKSRVQEEDGRGVGKAEILTG